MLDPEFPQVQDQGDQILELSRFDNIPVRPRLVAGADIQAVVGAGENHDRDVRVTRILFELLQYIDTPLAPQFEIEQDQGRFIAVQVIVEICHSSAAAVHDIQPALIPCLRQRLAKQFAFAGAVVDQQNGGGAWHVRG